MTYEAPPTLSLEQLIKLKEWQNKYKIPREEIRFYIASSTGIGLRIIAIAENEINIDLTDYSEW